MRFVQWHGATQVTQTVSLQGEKMRTAVFVGLLRVAIAINPMSLEAQSDLSWLIIAFIIADLVELVSKPTKRAPLVQIYQSDLL
jgi:hypothetical protein